MVVGRPDRSAQIEVILAQYGNRDGTGAAGRVPMGPIASSQVLGQGPNARMLGMVAGGDENEPLLLTARDVREDNERRRLRKQVARAEAAEARAAKEGREDAHLEALHEASGALINANARRLATLREGSARDVAKGDVAADIKRYVEFDVASKAACVRDYAERADVPMLVCGSCGLRDPDEARAMASHGTVDLATIPDEHWLHVGAGALARLRAAPAKQLLRVGGSAEPDPRAAQRARPGEEGGCGGKEGGRGGRPGTEDGAGRGAEGAGCGEAQAACAAVRAARACRRERRKAQTVLHRLRRGGPHGGGAAMPKAPAL